MTERKLHDDPALVTREEAAEMLRVSVSTVDRYLKDGLLPKSKVGTRLVRISRSAVESFVTPEVRGAA